MDWDRGVETAVPDGPENMGHCREKGWKYSCTVCGVIAFLVPIHMH